MNVDNLVVGEVAERLWKSKHADNVKLFFTFYCQQRTYKIGAKILLMFNRKLAVFFNFITSFSELEYPVKQ